MAKISQKLSLKQKLTPKQVLEASLLQLNLNLLEQRILEELEFNPALEMLEISENEIEEDIIDDKEQLEEEIDFEWDELLGENGDYEYSKPHSKNEVEFEAPLISQETISDKVLSQLQDCDVDEIDLKIAEQILGNLDEKGYLTIDPMLISDRMHVEQKKVLKVVNMIQRLEPPGLASKNMKECLIAQSEVRSENELATIILKDFFDDFVNHRYEKIIAEINCSKEDFKEAIEFVSRLNPSPKDDSLNLKQDIVVPDINVEHRDGKFYVIVQDGRLPELQVSKVYRNMLKEHKKEKEVYSFVKKKIESASWFVDALDQRKKTIQRVMESIIKYQSDYFYSENRSLIPMVLKDIADDLEIDISTVSRVTNGKYVQLPWEIRELKTFFSEGIKVDAGSDVSNIEVKKRLKNIIDSENKENPIKDEELTKILNKEGYKIARRTIAKYREQLKFPTARLRRKI